MAARTDWAKHFPKLKLCHIFCVLAHFVKIKKGSECKSENELLGNHESPEDCAYTCLKKVGCKFFVLGKGIKRGDCYWEKDADATCLQGWERDSFDFYRLVIPCQKDFHVVNNTCIACTFGAVRAAGDDPSGPDTACRIIPCDEHFHVVDNICVPCTFGAVRPAGDNPSGPDTACKIHCQLSFWGPWSSCSRSCGKGARSRQRTVLQEPKYGGVACGELEETQYCNVDSCPILVSGPTTPPSTSTPATTTPATTTPATTTTAPTTTSATTTPATTTPATTTPATTTPATTTTAPTTTLSTTPTTEPQVHCRLSYWGPWRTCSTSCGQGARSRQRTVLQEPMYGGDECGVLMETQYCDAGPCPMRCMWSAWSSWSDACNGDCGLPTAKKFRYRYLEQAQLDGESECVGESVQSKDCNFPVCNSTRYCEGSLLSGNLTKEMFKERRSECQDQCRIKCTRQDLCGDAPIQRRGVWTDPHWTHRWFGTALSKFMAEVALGDSFDYPSITVAPDMAYQPCMWLRPTCANASDCDFGTAFKKLKVPYVMDNFYQWYFTEGEINTRVKPGGDRESFRIGGKAMKSEDGSDPERRRCLKRCQSWCFESCSCNWGWEFPWSNTEDLGWRFGKPMRFRWIRSVQRKQSYGTWKCASSDGEPLRTPWDNAFWHLDVYSDAVKEHVNVAPLQFNLVCEHIKQYYALQVCGTEKCQMNCTKAAQPVVDFLYAKKMLQPEYMKNDGEKHRAELVDRLRKGIPKNCRRTCAEAHVPAVLHRYPIH